MLKETVAYNLPKCIWPIDNFDQPVFFNRWKRSIKQQENITLPQ